MKIHKKKAFPKKKNVYNFHFIHEKKNQREEKQKKIVQQKWKHIFFTVPNYIIRFCFGVWVWVEGKEKGRKKRNTGNCAKKEIQVQPQEKTFRKRKMKKSTWLCYLKSWSRERWWLRFEILDLKNGKSLKNDKNRGLKVFWSVDDVFKLKLVHLVKFDLEVWSVIGLKTSKHVKCW